ncbi:MAG TPA: hypothetical protein VFV34_06450 [Blastocatellia bacterium]|nr:hypothetical protein [Blastocatellia bacterium]
MTTSAKQGRRGLFAFLLSFVPSGTEASQELKFGTISAVLIGAVAVVVYAMGAEDWPSRLRVMSLCSLIAAAFGLLGMILGFLFGIPRTLTDVQSDRLRTETASPVRDPSDRAPVNYQVNTNLEQISDWLTKILVGVGLTQIQHIPDKVRQAAQSLGTGLPRGDGDVGFIMALILYSAAFGFLLGYLWTRLILAPMFRTADFRLLEREARAAERETKAQKVLQSAEEKEQQTLEKLKYLEETLGKMHDGLYEYENQGFRRTIESAHDFQQKWGEPKDVMFWIRLAAAYGQQFRWDKEKSVSTQVLDEDKRRAFEAIDKALASDKAFAQYWLKYLGDPEYQGKPRTEDDLEVFWDDPEFRQRVV